MHTYALNWLRLGWFQILTCVTESDVHYPGALLRNTYWPAVTSIVSRQSLTASAIGFKGPSHPSLRQQVLHDSPVMDRPLRSKQFLLQSPLQVGQGISMHASQSNFSLCQSCFHLCHSQLLMSNKYLVFPNTILLSASGELKWQQSPTLLTGR